MLFSTVSGTLCGTPDESTLIEAVAIGGGFVGVDRKVVAFSVEAAKEMIADQVTVIRGPATSGGDGDIAGMTVRRIKNAALRGPAPSQCIELLQLRCLRWGDLLRLARCTRQQRKNGERA